MSAEALNLLKALGLLGSSYQVSDLSDFDEDNLRSILVYYAKSRLEQASNDIEEHGARQGTLSALASSFSSRNVAEPLLPSCLVYDRVFTDDPVCGLVDVRDDPQGRTHRASLGFPEVRSPDAARVASALTYFQDLAPLILEGVVVCLPVECLHLPPLHRPLGFSEDWFRSSVPQAVHDYVHQRAIVKELRRGKDGAGLIVVPGVIRQPVGGISISFRNDDPVTGEHIYVYHHGRIVSLSDDRHATMVMAPAWDDPPDEEIYRAWVYQSVNLSILARLESMSRELHLADRVGATYLTESSFEASLCAKSGAQRPNNHAPVDAVNFLRANEPSLAIESAEQVARVRSRNTRLFTQFHRSLLDVSVELAGEENFVERAQQLFASEIAPRIADVTDASRKLGLAAAGAACGFALAVFSSTVLPLSAVVTLAATQTATTIVPAMRDYLKLRGGPAFIWRKIAK